MVKINTSYSFGMDDQDFVVAFESNEADKFVNLVQELRETESSLYTAAGHAHVRRACRRRWRNCWRRFTGRRRG